jgi:hypothetical protein
MPLEEAYGEIVLNNIRDAVIVPIFLQLDRKNKGILLTKITYY